MQQAETKIAETKARHQKALVAFLSADLDLAGTFLDTAKIDAQSDPVHARKLIGAALSALRTVRSFQSRIEDPAERARVNDKADRLELEIKSFPISN